MGGVKELLNKKMYKVAATIVDVIEKTFPPQYLNFVFSGKLTLDDVVIQTMVECCKFAYDNTAEKHSLKHYLKTDNLTEDYNRMAIQRVVKYINERRLSQYEYYKNNFGMDVAGLNPPDMGDIEKRLQGYSFNEFQYWEINNVHDMLLVKAIVDRRISSKNFTQKTLEAYADEYDAFCHKTMNNSQSDAKEIVFNSLAIFTLEWKYSFDFLYEIASEMEKCKVTKIPDLRRLLVVFCGVVEFTSMLSINNPVPVSYIGESRMIIQRRRYIHDVVDKSKEKMFDAEIRKYAEGMYIVGAMITNMTYSKIPIKDWFIANTTHEDWASVFNEYNVFQAWVPNKVWTKKKVKYIKEMYDLISMNYKNPDFRS